MTLSRLILAVLLLIIGGMIETVHKDVERLKGEVTAMAGKIDALPLTTEPRLQRVTGWIGKPRVPPVRHVYKKAPDPLCPRS